MRKMDTKKLLLGGFGFAALLFLAVLALGASALASDDYKKEIEDKFYDKVHNSLKGQETWITVTGGVGLAVFVALFIAVLVKMK